MFIGNSSIANSSTGTSQKPKNTSHTLLCTYPTPTFSYPFPSTFAICITTASLASPSRDSVQLPTSSTKDIKPYPFRARIVTRMDRIKIKIKSLIRLSKDHQQQSSKHKQQLERREYKRNKTGIIIDGGGHALQTILDRKEWL